MFFLPLVISFVIFLHLTLAINQSTSKKSLVYEEELKEFVTVNVIKSNITDFSFITTRKPSVLFAIKNLTDLSKKNMIIPNTDFANIDLKYNSSFTDISKIIEYEENYFNYIYNLNNLGKTLLDEGLFSESQIILEEAISCNSFTSITYITYYDLFSKLSKKISLEEFFSLENVNKSLLTQEYCKKIIKAYIISQKQL